LEIVNTWNKWRPNSYVQNVGYDVIRKDTAPYIHLYSRKIKEKERERESNKGSLNVPRYKSLFPATLPILACHLPC